MWNGVGWDGLVGAVGELFPPRGLYTANIRQSWSQIGYQDTQANLKIANDTRRDSSRMRSIAFLTMIFLPATFIAVCLSAKMMVRC